MPIRAGDLKDRLRIERATVTRNGLNEPVNAWAEMATVWAKYEPVSDGEKFRAGELAATMSSRFLIRKNNTTKTITPKDQAVHEGIRHEIIRVKPVGDDGIELTTASRADGGV